MMEIAIDFIKQLKQRILTSRYIVAKLANAESLRLYFSIGKMVDDEFHKNKWGAKVNDEIAARLQQELPGLRGFSGNNIRKMRRFYSEWSGDNAIWSSMTTKLESFGNKENIICSSLTSKLENDDSLISSSATNQLDDEQINAFFSTPFTHHYEIILKTDAEQERWYYIYKTAQNFWPVRHLRTETMSEAGLNDFRMNRILKQAV